LPRSNKVTIIGLDETVKALRAIGTPARAISAAGIESAQIVAREARTLAPVRTGRLRGSIAVARTQKGAAIKAGNASILYANPIHWGWFRDYSSARARATKSGSIARNIKPNPFLDRALGLKKGEVLEAYRRNMNKLISEETAKARKGSKK
jgi:hypothetical protein